MNFSMVVAINQKGVIGNNGDMPWDIPEDLKRFRNLTSEMIVVMGRRTYEAILKRNGRPLPNRINVVFSKTLDSAEGCIVCRNIKDLLEIVRREQKAVFIIGGEEIYKLFLPYVGALFITRVPDYSSGDTFFPEYDKSEWTLVNSSDGKQCTFEAYARKIPVVVDETYAKSGQYAKDLEEIKNLGVCPFCPGQMHWHPKPILKTEGNWLVTENGWPYTNSTTHLLFICHEHKTSILEMTPGDWKDLMVLFEYAVEKYDIKGGALCGRFGETLYTGATVVHLHFHIVVPTTDNDENGKRKHVSFPIG